MTFVQMRYSSNGIFDGPHFKKNRGGILPFQEKKICVDELLYDPGWSAYLPGRCREAPH